MTIATPPTTTTAPRIAKPNVRAAPDAVDGRDSYAVTAFSDIIDRSLHAAAARFTMGLSPAALAKAYMDWATHLALSPGKRLQLVDKATRKAVRFANYAGRSALQSSNADCLSLIHIS